MSTVYCSWQETKDVTNISLSVKEKDMANTHFILSPYPYTDDTILRKNPTNTLI